MNADQIARAARTLWESRPVAYYAWSGVEQHSDATQIVRAIGQLYALTGSLDTKGGNILFPSVSTNAIAGDELLAPSDARRRWDCQSVHLVRRVGNSSHRMSSTPRLWNRGHIAYVDSSDSVRTS